MDLKSHTEEEHVEFLGNAAFSDLKAFNVIMDFIPDNAQMQIGNSASIRYVQLINKKRNVLCLSNRGTSGIEGSVSTALGSSMHFKHQTITITGDLSLMYDSNALWNRYLHSNFKIIVMNNAGGGIFRIIEGPKSINRSKEFIETRHENDFSKLADMHDLAFFRAKNEEELRSELPKFLQENNKAALLEVITPTEENDKILMNYFESLKTTT